MGFYWNTFVCFGFYTTDLNIINLIDKTWYSKLSKGVVIYIPGTYRNFKNIDPVIEKHEIEQGYVSKDEVTKHLKLAENHFIVSDDDTTKLKELLNKCGLEDDKIKIWIIETMYSTLDMFSSIELCQMLPVQ